MSKDLLDIHFAAESRRSADAAICPRGDVCTIKKHWATSLCASPLLSSAIPFQAESYAAPRLQWRPSDQKAAEKWQPILLPLLPSEARICEALAELIRIHDGDELDLRVQARE